MPHPEHVLRIKQVSPDLRFLLAPSTDTTNPRKTREPITTITTWHRNMEFSDEPTLRSPEEYLLTLWEEVFPGLTRTPNGPAADLQDLPEDRQELIRNTPYPGILEHIHLRLQDTLKLTIQNPHDPWDPGWLGYIHISQEDMRKHKLTPDQAREIIRQDLQELQEWANGNRYDILIQRDGHTDLVLGPISAADDGAPDPEHLDQAIRDNGDLSPEEAEAAIAQEWREARRIIDWEPA